MTIWHTILKIMMTSLFAGLVIAIIFLTLKFMFTSKHLLEILQNYKTAIYVTLLLVIFSIPTVFSLVDGQLLSPVIFAIYVRELIVSIIIVITFWIVWIVLDDPTAVKRNVLLKLFRLLLTVWEKDLPMKDQVTYSTRSAAIDFFAMEYYQINDLIGDRLLESSLKVCRLIYVPAKFPMICDKKNPFEEYAYVRPKDYAYVESSDASLAEMILRDRYRNYYRNKEDVMLFGTGF